VSWWYWHFFWNNQSTRLQSCCNEDIWCVKHLPPQLCFFVQDYFPSRFSRHVGGKKTWVAWLENMKGSDIYGNLCWEFTTKNPASSLVYIGFPRLSYHLNHSHLRRIIGAWNGHNPTSRCPSLLWRSSLRNLQNQRLELGTRMQYRCHMFTCVLMWNLLLGNGF
jgi:hypothetical protein